MKKRILSFILTIIMATSILTITSLTVSALPDYYSVTGGQIEFDSTTKAIVSYTGSPTSVVIPEKIYGTPVESIGIAFYNCKSLTCITIPSSVTSIEESAFYGCNNLQTIYGNFQNSYVKIYAKKNGIEYIDSFWNLKLSDANNGKISEPNVPTSTNYTFIGWYKEDKYVDEWIFGNDVMTDNITLYAKWQLITNKTTVLGTNSSLPYKTIKEHMFFAVNENTIGYVVTLRYNSNNLRYNSVIPKDFAYVYASVPIDDTENTGCKLVTITCQYIDSDYCDGNKLINPFDINFDVLSTATIENTEVTIVNNTETDNNNLYAISSTNNKIYFSDVQNSNLEIIQIATSISINGSSNISQLTQYSIDFVPTYTTNKNVQWDVNDESIATIDSKGNLSPIKNGNLIIYAKTVDGSNLTVSRDITISSQNATIDSLSSNKGIWDKGFKPNVYDYTIYVPLNTQNIELTPNYASGMLTSETYGNCSSGAPINIDLTSDNSNTILKCSRDSGYDLGIYSITIKKDNEFLKKQYKLSLNNLIIDGENILNIEKLENV